MPSNARKAGKAVIVLSVDDRVSEGLKKVQKQFKAVGSTITGIGAGLSGVAASILGPLGGAVSQFVSMGDALDKMSQRTGFGAQALSELSHAAGLSGTNIESVEKAIRGMQRNLLDAAQGQQAAIDKFTELGLSISDLQGLSPEDQFNRLADAVANIDDPTRKAAASMDIFGKAGSDLLPLFANGSEGLAAMRKEAVDLGVTMSDEDATAAAVLGDAIGRLKEQMKAIAVQVGAAVAGPLTEFADWLKEHLKSVIDWIKDNGELIVTIGKVGAGIAALGAPLVALGGSLQLAAVGIGGLNTALSLLIVHPAIAGIAAITAGVVLLANEFRKAQDAYNEFDEALDKTSGKTTVTDAAELSKLTSRFDQLAAKTKLTKEETGEALEVIHKLRMEYGKLSATVKDGKVVDAEKLRAQIGAVRGGKSDYLLRQQLALAEASLDTAKAEERTTAEIKERADVVAKLREELALTEKLVANAKPGSPVAGVPGADLAKSAAMAAGAAVAAEQSGEEAGAAFGEAFNDYMQQGLNSAGTFLSDMAQDGLDAIGGVGDWAADQLGAIQAQLSEAGERARNSGTKNQRAILDATYAGQQFGDGGDSATFESIDASGKEQVKLLRKMQGGGIPVS